SATSRIRVGSGGIMLPNHAPLRIAEAFHTLETLHPGRIDFGVGRAPGTDPVTSRAMHPFDAEQFPQQLQEVLGLSASALPPDHPFHRVRVVPSGVRFPPVWLLGSSGASARFAGSLGIGYAFARHFSPVPPEPAVHAYLESFTPSETFPRPQNVPSNWPSARIWCGSATSAASSACCPVPRKRPRTTGANSSAWWHA